MARGRQYGTVPPWSNQEEEKEETTIKVVNIYLKGKQL